MNLEKVTQAILLLTVVFNTRESSEVKPLTPSEYARFAVWLHQQEYTPADLLGNADDVLSSWVDPKRKITTERIKQLLARGASMGFALEHWRSQGVWVVSRGSADYPARIRKHLKDSRPPIIFGIGNSALLNRSGIGFVGSRSIDESDAEFTKKLASLAVAQGYAVISGGAKGIDQTSVQTALELGGEAVAVVADSLLKASTKSMYRTAIQEGRLLLMSTVNPEARFTVGNAMGRNKYIYTLSEAVVAVKSDFGEGGTWSGAVENLKKVWVPLLVRQSEHKGNQALIEQGAHSIDDCFKDFSSVFDMEKINRVEKKVESNTSATENLDLFSQVPNDTER